jgi:hypothetical protein
MKIASALGGHAEAENKATAGVANLDAAVRDGVARAGSNPTYVHVGHYGRADAHIGAYFAPPEGDLSYLLYAWDGVTGEFRGAKPGLGSQASAGASTYTILSALHYGYFAGVVSKLVWLALGFASCYMILTGMRMWFVRRRDEAAWSRWEPMVPVIGYGLPLAMLVSAHSFFVALGRGDALFWTPLGFVAAALAAIALGVVVRDRELLTRILLFATIAATLLLPAVRMLSGGTGWAEALEIGAPIVVSIDVTLFVAAAFLLLTQTGFRRFLPGSRAAEPRAGLEPAE